jgi:hypothetical protein
VTRPEVPRLRLSRLTPAPVLALALVFLPPSAEAQRVPDTARAVRVSGEIRMDGMLSERVWQTAPAVTRLLQREPDEGQPAVDSTEVRFAYDEHALYVGARMYSANPSEIRALVTRRDQEGISEFIAVTLDTYYDRRTAYSFGVTPSGVRLDFFHPSDNGDGDSGYDPVWEARARVDSAGWTAEMRIPFNQLRFSPRDEQLWGVNVIRRVPARNEESYWQLIRPHETGWASRMGVLAGISGVAPSRRVELLPYAASGSRIRDVTDPRNPFQDRTETEARVGGDLKLGLGPNLTLDVTLNPDFGQVEADPAIVNLSAYEVFFDERRPFFNEGADLLNRRGLFYSRRIGAPPPGRAAGDYVESRSNSTILGAAKLTGRLPSRLSVAGLAAVTDREVVRTFDSTSGSFGRVAVAPRTMYAAASAQQEFGRDASTISALVTAVQRDVAPGTPLGSLLARSAYSGIVESRYRWAGGAYDVNFWLGGTNVRGDSSAILRQQLSSRRYWQRPDAGHVEVDPSRTALQGAFFGIGHSKVAGRHWLWDLDYTFESPGFEPNDAGAFGAVDSRFVFGRLRWRETQPSRWYRSYEVGVGSENGWNFDWMRRFNGVFAFANTTLPNYWRFNSDYYRARRGMSDRLTRGGPLMATPAEYGVEAELRSRSGARNGWGVELGTSGDENGGFRRGVELSLSLRPGTQLEISFDPEWGQTRDTRQYVMSVGGGPAATFGRRYVFAAVDLSEVSGRIRANYTFTPNLSLETYAQPFAASGRFHRFGQLAAAGSGELLAYGTSGTTITRNPDGSHTVTDGGASFDIEPLDFNVRSFRSNAVLRWEWRPGSTMFLVWQQDREGDRAFRTARPGDLLDALRTRGDSFLALKVTYWLALD